MEATKKKKSKDWLILNAILAYLHNYPSNTWTQQYQELRDELTKPTEVRKRGRPAKDKGRKKPQQLRQAKERRKHLILKLHTNAH